MEEAAYIKFRKAPSSKLPILLDVNELVEQQSSVKGIWDTTTSEKVIAPIVDWSGGFLKPKFLSMA
jgi:hypothetical protein